VEPVPISTPSCTSFITTARFWTKAGRTLHMPCRRQQRRCSSALLVSSGGKSQVSNASKLK
jgi:hypothetical protein